MVAEFVCDVKNSILKIQDGGNPRWRLKIVVKLPKFATEQYAYGCNISFYMFLWSLNRFMWSKFGFDECMY